MLRVDFEANHKDSFKMLCLGAHSDDIEIGCGGTILRLLRKTQGCDVRWIVFSANEKRTVEAKESAEIFLADAAEKSIVVHDFRDGYFPYNGALIKDFFETLKLDFSPDLIFTHYKHDNHQDHRLINELTWNTFRDHFILEYEIPKYDGDIGNPNFYVHLSQSLLRSKIKLLSQRFATQNRKDWFTDTTFFSLARLRGVESKALEGYAEAFYCRKMTY